MSPPKRALPKKIGPYEIERQLARGGMGEVVLATNTLLDRQTALKRVLPERDDGDSEEGQEDAVQRFLREGKLLARLHHQGVCAVYDIVTYRGAYWMALEYVDGHDLRALLKHGALPPDIALIIATSVADALDHAHRNGVVHRDVKPANVMVSRRGEVKLLDFGIARATDVEALTATGMVVGTPTFMAPEVLRGMEADPRSDVYSLGATLYRCLAGRPLFKKAPPEVISQQIIQGDIPPLRRVNPAVPRRISRLVHKCLALDPQKRFASAGELHDALESERIRLGIDAGSPAERLVAFLYRDGHLSAEEALTVVDPGVLEASRTKEAPPAIRPQLPLAAGFVLAVLLVVVAVATWDTWLPTVDQWLVAP
ncbi:MAG: serine/threonine-protein kinase [Myxococcota bacterium]